MGRCLPCLPPLPPPKKGRGCVFSVAVEIAKTRLASRIRLFLGIDRYRRASRVVADTHQNYHRRDGAGISGLVAPLFFDYLCSNARHVLERKFLGLSSWLSRTFIKCFLSLSLWIWNGSKGMQNSAMNHLHGSSAAPHPPPSRLLRPPHPV